MKQRMTRSEALIQSAKRRIERMEQRIANLQEKIRYWDIFIARRERYLNSTAEKQKPVQ